MGASTTWRERAASGLPWLLAGLTLAAWALHALYYFPRTVDDLYIFLRYAENFAGGEGLVYNPGERVEGYSSPLWLLLLSLGVALGFNALTWSKLLALASLAALLVGLYRLAREEAGLGPQAAWLVLLVTGCNSFLVSWTFWGLETPAHLALLIWTALALRRHRECGSRANFWWASVTGVALVLCRPEAPLLYGCVVMSLLSFDLDRRALPRRIRRLAGPVAIAAAALVAYYVFRRLYFGLWLPHTYYAKQGSHFDFALWKPLVAEGASLAEAVYTTGGLALAFWSAVTRRSSLTLWVAAGTLFFVGSVERDWMPNQRHFLPIYVLLPLPWLSAASAALQGLRGSARLRQGVALAAAAGVAAVLGASAFDMARVDGRYTRKHPQAGWGPAKTASRWDDALACLARRRPAHVDAMHPLHMGMIKQLYFLLEADARPLEESWYVGRDIGRVGWFAPVRVFDTDGLFTPAVVHFDSWRETGHPDRNLIDAAFARPVVVTELYDGWAWHSWRVPRVRAHYQPLFPGDTRHLVPRPRHPPSPQQVLARYRAAVAKLPTSFHVATLWGEAVGAALERRLEIVEAEQRAKLR